MAGQGKRGLRHNLTGRLTAALPSRGYAMVSLVVCLMDLGPAALMWIACILSRCSFHVSGLDSLRRVRLSA